ncbi:transposable element Tcb2 transposase [Trichonephila clavipes]|nr:transposable element Tcb2 transposase [Trichonephila clavipes]
MSVQICREFNLTPSVVRNLRKQFQDTGSIERIPGQGRPRATTARENRHLSIITRHQWVTVQFTDESRFSQNTDSRCTFIWREPGNHYLPSDVRKIDNYGKEGLMVCAGIILDGRTPLHVFKRDSVTGVRYIFLCAAREIVIFFRSGRKVIWVVTPAIEHVWDGLGRAIATHNPIPRAVQEMKTALVNEWDHLPQELINCLISTCFGSVMGLILSGTAGCDIVTQITAFSLTMAFGGFWYCSYMISYLDMSPEYAGLRFKPRAGQGRLSLSSLQWVDKREPSLLGNLTLGVFRAKLTTCPEHLLMHLSAQNHVY